MTIQEKRTKTLEGLMLSIHEYQRDCRRTEYTDTNVAHELLEWILAELNLPPTDYSNLQDGGKS